MSGVLSHRGLFFGGLALSKGDYGFIVDTPSAAQLTYKDNNRTITAHTNTNTTSYTSTVSHRPSWYGKYCLEYVINDVGVASAAVRVGIKENNGPFSNIQNGIILRDDGLLVMVNEQTATTVNSSGGGYEFTTGDVIGFYCDFETGTVELAKNGVNLYTFTGFFTRNRFVYVAGHVDMNPTTSGPQKPSVTFVDGAYGFNYPRSAFKPWVPYKSKVAFDPTKTESGISTTGDGTSLYNNTGTSQSFFSVGDKGYTTGKHFFSVSRVGTTVDSQSRIGIVSESFDPFTATDLGASGAGNVSSVGLSMSYGANSIISYTNFDGVTSSTTNSQLSNSGIRDVMTVAIDLDSSPKTCKFYSRGTLTHTINLPNGKTWFPAIQVYDERITTMVNFGQHPHLYPLSGYQNWDASLPLQSAKQDPYSEYVYNMHTFDAGANIDTDKRNMAWSATGSPAFDGTTKKFGERSVALVSDATNQYFHPARDIFISPQKTATIEFWVRPSTLSHATDATIVFVGSLDNLASGFSLKWKNQSFLRLEANDGDDFTTIDSGAISADTWYFVQIIRDDTNIQLCVDGVSIGQSAYPNTFTHSVIFGTGRGSSDVTTAFKGHYDDVRITRFVARSPALPTESMSKY